MNAKRVQQATVLALALTLERLFEALENDKPERAIEQALILEQGTSLLTASLAETQGVTDEALSDLRRELTRLIDEAPDTAEVFSVAVDAAFIEQRNNAKLN